MAPRLALHQVNDTNTLMNRKKRGFDKVMIGPSLLPTADDDELELKSWSNCEDHAKRLKMRLKLAYFKVQTNQTRLSLTDLATTTTTTTSATVPPPCRPSQSKPKCHHIRTQSEPVVLFTHQLQPPPPMANGSGSFSPFAKSRLASSSKRPPPKSPSPYKTPQAAAAAYSNNNNNNNSSPLRPKSLLSSAIKGTPNQMGAARSLLDLGCY